MHVPCQAKAFEGPDEAAGEIELPPVKPGEGRAREGMMIVTPALAETQKRHNPLVAALVSRLELTLAKAVADGIGTKGHVMHQENPHQTRPEEPCPPANYQRDAER